MLNLNSIMIGSSKPKEMATFYEKILGSPDWEDNEWWGWQVGGSMISIGPHSEIKGKAREPERLILNFETNEVESEFERIKKAGGVVVKEPYEMQGMMIATLADPDGNYFQLMSPWEEDYKN